MTDLATIWAAEDSIPSGTTATTDDPNGTSGADTIIGTEDGDTLSGGGGRDTIYGADGDDSLSGGGNPDTLYGGAGDDTLDGGNASDILVGGSGDDSLDGGKSADTLIGGEGDDTLLGERSSDTFVFRFCATETDGETYYFRPDDDGTGGDTPSLSANMQAWENYLEQLAIWRAEMAAEYGGDSDTDEAVVELISKKWAGTEIDYDNSYTVGGGLAIEGEGHDQIMDFDSVADDDGTDVLRLEGISLDQAKGGIGVNANGTDTVLSWDGGSITLVGVSNFDWDAWHSDGMLIFG